VLSSGSTKARSLMNSTVTMFPRPLSYTGMREYPGKELVVNTRAMYATHDVHTINKYSKHTHDYLVQSKHIRLVLWILDNGQILIYILFVCNYMHIIQRNTQTQYKQTCSCTQMFAPCGNRTRDLLGSRRVFRSQRQIGRLM
jgi:hypothetical protein